MIWVVGNEVFQLMINKQCSVNMKVPDDLGSWK